MALITKWPDSTGTLYDNKQWNWNTWLTGTPITQKKLENLENGVAILATQMKAVLGEFNPTSLDDAQLNSSRLDSIQTWITGTSSTTYSGTNIISRLSSTDTEITNLKTRATSIESINTSQNNRLTALENELNGSGTGTSSSSRLDNLQTWITGTSSGNYSGSSIISRLKNFDDLNINSRLGTLETDNTNNKDIINKHSNKLAAIIAEIGGSGNDGTNTQYGGTSRIDNLQNWITGTIDGTYNEASITSRLKNIDDLNIDSRLTTLETSDTTNKININLLQTDNTTNKNNINNIINEIGGTYTSSGFSNSQISKISSILEKNDEQDNNINKIKLEVWGPDKVYSDESRIDFLENGLSQTNSLVGTFTSTLHRLENEIETATITSKTLLLRTTNVEDSDTLILESTAILAPEAITLIMLNAATLGQNYIEIQDPNGEILYPVYITNNLKLKANFSAGSLLGIYLDKDAKAYMFNAPLTV